MSIQQQSPSWRFRPPHGSAGQALSYPMFVTVYLGTIAIVGLGALLAHRLLGIALMRAVYIESGFIFLLSARGVPWWLFAVIRGVGWFALIESDRMMRWVLVIMGTTFLLGAILAR